MENLQSNIEKYKRELEELYKKSRSRAEISAFEPAPPVPSNPPGETAPIPSAPPQSAVPAPSKQPIVLPFESEASRTAEDAWNDYCRLCTAEGFLKTQVFTARRAFPVEGATVTISKSFPEGRHIIAVETSDESGNTPMISLPAVSRTLSEKPGNALPYTAFDMTVEHPGFNTMYYYNIPIFDGVYSEQTADLIPIASTPSDENFNRIIEKEPPSLWGGR